MQISKQTQENNTLWLISSLFLSLVRLLFVIYLWFYSALKQTGGDSFSAIHQWSMCVSHNNTTNPILPYVCLISLPHKHKSYMCMYTKLHLCQPTNEANAISPPHTHTHVHSSVFSSIIWSSAKLGYVMFSLPANFCRNAQTMAKLGSLWQDGTAGPAEVLTASSVTLFRLVDSTTTIVFVSPMMCCLVLLVESSSDAIFVCRARRDESCPNRGSATVFSLTCPEVTLIRERPFRQTHEIHIVDALHGVGGPLFWVICSVIQ